MSSLGIGQRITPDSSNWAHALDTYDWTDLCLHFMDTATDIWTRFSLSTFLYALRHIHLLLGRMTLIYYGVSLSSTTSGCTIIRITKPLIGQYFVFLAFLLVDDLGYLAITRCLTQLDYVGSSLAKIFPTSPCLSLLPPPQMQNCST